MRRFSRNLWPGVLPLLALSASVGAASLGEEDLVKALQSGGYVILMRHASSPRAAPEAARANPDNPQHERQLDDLGRTSARSMGAAVRQLHIPIGQVLSSPTYRALETARLAQFASPKTYVELGDAGHSMQGDTSGERGTWIRSRVAAAPPRGTNTVIITHFPNVLEAFPEEARGLEDGEALIFRPDGHGGAAFVARVKIEEWARWAGLPRWRSMPCCHGG